jgi:hypothetical protein
MGLGLSLKLTGLEVLELPGYSLCSMITLLHTDNLNTLPFLVLKLDFEVPLRNVFYFQQAILSESDLFV